MLVLRLHDHDVCTCASGNVFLCSPGWFLLPHACRVRKTLPAPKSRRHFHTRRTCIRPALKAPTELFLLLCFFTSEKTNTVATTREPALPRSSSSFAQWSSPLFQLHLVFLKWASGGRNRLTGPICYGSPLLHRNANYLLAVHCRLATASRIAARQPRLPQRFPHTLSDPDSPSSAPVVENWQSHLYHSCHV